jgi:hypothetical protein
MASSLLQTSEKPASARHHYKRNPPASVESAAFARRNGPLSLAVWRRGAGVTFFYTLAAIYFTWPLAMQFRTHTIGHMDPPFSAWRLAWIARNLVQGGTNLFDANIFWPSPRTLAFSDAMLVQGTLAVPLTALGFTPLELANLLTLLAMVLSGVAAYVLARRLSGHIGAALLAGLVFAFSPYRLDHLAHLELQWAFWIPLAVWAWHRMLDGGRWVDGMLCGVFVLLQLLSSIYYGLFLATTFVVLGGITFVQRWRTARGFPLSRPALAGLVLGGVVLGLGATEYARPYRLAESRVGERGIEETRRYSAKWSSFITTRPDNRVYGPLTGEWDEEEKRLHPGLTPVVLGAAAFVPAIPPAAIAYGASLLFSADMAMGMNGRIFPLLRKVIPQFRGLRAPARFGVLVQLCVAVLAALGLAQLTRRWPRMATPLVACALTLTVVEYSARPLALMGMPTKAPPIYKWLSLQPKGIVTLELPVPRPNALPEQDPYYQYNSIFHWQPLVNGYSGHYFRPYIDLLEDMKTYPSERADRAIQRSGAQLIIVHRAFYPVGRYEPLIEKMDANPKLQLIKISDDMLGEARAYLFLPNYRAKGPGAVGN